MHSGVPMETKRQYPQLDLNKKRTILESSGTGVARLSFYGSVLTRFLTENRFAPFLELL